MKRKAFFDLIDAILIACGFVVQPTRFDHRAVTLLQTCRAHLFAKLSKSYRPRYGLFKESIDMLLPVIYDTLVDIYRRVYRSFYPYKSVS